MELWPQWPNLTYICKQCERQYKEGVYNYPRTKRKETTGKGTIYVFNCLYKNGNNVTDGSKDMPWKRQNIFPLFTRYRVYICIGKDPGGGGVCVIWGKKFGKGEEKKEESMKEKGRNSEDVLKRKVQRYNIRRQG
jgi:hypothetical protein